MVNRKKTNIRENDNLNPTRSHAAFEAPQHNSHRTNSKDKSNNDDIIVSLSNAYENKRARQVFEWELLRRQNIQYV